jgi:putative colanic acid biosynthesis UDP-glucose lipid carrier transferase
MIVANQHIQSDTGNKPFRNYIDNKEIFLLLKRFFDIILSTLVIIFLLSWLIPIMAIAIKLNSKGPVFFIQRRVGRGLRSFGCIKFRTMIPNNQADKHVACKNDDRVTKLGKFLRKTSLDELPQFINVFIGDMSIVGPRPHMFVDCHRFSEYIQDYKVRNIVRPGITGLAQVKGFRGPAEDSYTIVSRFYYDSVYIQNLSFRMDVIIVFNTVWQVLNLIFFQNVFKKEEAKKIDSDPSKIGSCSYNRYYFFHYWPVFLELRQFSI